MSKSKKFDVFQETTNQIIEILDNHKAGGYDNNWLSTRVDIFPINPISGHQYNGISMFWLSYWTEKLNYNQNRWVTWDQVKNAGRRVKITEEAEYMVVAFFSFRYRNMDGKDVTSNATQWLRQGMDLPEGVKKVLFDKSYRVYNLDQCEDLPKDLFAKKKTLNLIEFDKDEMAEEYLSLSGANLLYKENHIPCYDHTKDEIVLPLREQYKGKENFYSDATHELGHWTGHGKRLDRPVNFNRSSSEYALEELIVELFSSFVCASMGFTSKITDSAAFIESWLQILKNDKKFVFNAAKQAQEAMEFTNSIVNYRLGANKQIHI